MNKNACCCMPTQLNEHILHLLVEFVEEPSPLTKVAATCRRIETSTQPRFRKLRRKLKWWRDVEVTARREAIARAVHWAFDLRNLNWRRVRAYQIRQDTRTAERINRSWLNQLQLRR